MGLECQYFGLARVSKQINCSLVAIDKARFSEQKDGIRCLIEERFEPILRSLQLSRAFTDARFEYLAQLPHRLLSSLTL